jgi:Na+/phosphate symporter
MDLKTKVKLKPFLHEISEEEDRRYKHNVVYESDLTHIVDIIKKDILDELKDRINWDKEHMQSLGWTHQSTKGHVRSIMFIEEMKNEKI